MTEPGRGAERVKPSERVQEPWRSDAQVDIDRILYSPEFRRLGGVTQVVPPQVDYQFHDRLSHSVKVAQVASTLARQLIYSAKKEASNLPPEVVDRIHDWVDPDYCYVAGLAHDIGHPPFGHAGEVALQKYSQEAEIEYEPDDAAGGIAVENLEKLKQRSFEGNAQSTRVVAELSFRRDELEPGLNLTLRSMAAIAKYPWLKGGHPARLEKLASKWSFYAEEETILDDLVTSGFVLPIVKDDVVVDVHRWVESEIMDWADDISYAVHDLEDFFRAGLIPLHQISSAFHASHLREDWSKGEFGFVQNEEVRDYLMYIHAKIKAFARTHLGEVTEAQVDKTVAGAFSKISRDLVNEMPTAAFSGTRESHARLQDFGSTLIKYLTSSAHLVFHEDIQRVQLSIDPEAVLVAEFYKALNKIFVIDSAMLSAAQYGQSADVDALCDSLFELSLEWLAKPAERNANRRLPPRLREYLRDATGDAGEDNDSDYDYVFVLIRVIDYVCSLSDFQASRLAAHLKGSSSMGVLDGRWLDS